MATEIERRFLVHEINPSALIGAERLNIVQGYFKDPSPFSQLRVRIIDGKRAVLTGKEGFGVVRNEEEIPIGVREAQFLLGHCWHVIEKTRFRTGEWEIDYFKAPLNGLIIGEYEHASALDGVTLPPWIFKATEVTDSLSNLHLARLATDLKASPNNQAELTLYNILAAQRIPLVVLTGGPCCGKTTFLGMLREKLPNAVHCVPEVASIVIGQLGITPPGDSLGMLRFEQTLGRIQSIFEATSLEDAVRSKKTLMVLDRGSMDRAAYLQGGIEQLVALDRTTAQHEYGRYAIVLCFEVPPPEIYETQRRNNPARSETYEQAMALQERIKLAWNSHPNFHLVRNAKSWEEKEKMALCLIAPFLPK